MVDGATAQLSGDNLATFKNLTGELMKDIQAKDFGKVISSLANLQVVYKNLVAAGKLEFSHRFLWRTPIESEWVTTYRAIHGGPFFPDPAEIAGLRFWTRAEIAAALGTGQLTPAFEDEFRRRAT